MDERTLMDIKFHHNAARLVMGNLKLPMLCSVCGEVTHSTTETIEVDLRDMHGGIYWSVEKEVPVWKCKQGHTIRIALIGGIG